MKSPMMLVCVENDQLFPEETLNDGTQYLKANGVEHEVKIYPGVPHGFAVIGEYADANIKKAQGEAFEQMLGFLRGH